MPKRKISKSRRDKRRTHWNLNDNGKEIISSSEKKDKKK